MKVGNRVQIRSRDRFDGMTGTIMGPQDFDSVCSVSFEHVDNPTKPISHIRWGRFEYTFMAEELVSIEVPW